ncbi:MAG: hypothetical protein LQ338_007371 [Usnochroma carphineum]|nr:MAG: hypothetical protein LQ338_007371 [Usnochroma carphineum]
MADVFYFLAVTFLHQLSASLSFDPTQPYRSSPHNTMKIHHPPRPSASSPIIIYLPSGLPSAKGSNEQDHEPSHSLALSAHATVVYSPTPNPSTTSSPPTTGFSSTSSQQAQPTMTPPIPPPTPPSASLVHSSAAP